MGSCNSIVGIFQHNYIFALFTVISKVSIKMMCGGTGDVQVATDGHEIHEICNSVKESAAGKTGKNGFDMFVVKSFKSQVVAGTNFFAKVQIADGEHLHLRIYRNLQGQIELHSLQEGKTEEDAIEYF